MPHGGDLADQPPPQEGLELNSLPSSTHPVRVRTRPVSKLARRWTSDIAPWLPHTSAIFRDHLANERTFLSHIRTANAFAIFGISIAQLFRLRQNPVPGFSFYSISVPLSACCQIIAIILAIGGGLRFIRHQRALERGNALAGGGEPMVAGIITLVLLLVLAVVVVVLDVQAGP